MSETILADGTVLNDAATAPGQTDVVPDGTSITVTGTFDNAGTLFDDSVNYTTTINIGTGAGTGDTILEGAGIVLLSESSGNRVIATAAGDRLVNVDNTIEGGGSLGAQSGLAILNEAAGTIDGNADGTALVIQTGGQIFLNQGLIEASGAGSVVIANNSTITNTGTILAAGANVTLQSGADIVGGLLAASGAGGFFVSNATLDGSTAIVTIGDGTNAEVDDGASLTLLGTIDLIGTLADGSLNYNTDLILGSPTVTLTGSGALVLSDSSANRIYGGSSTDDTLVNKTTITGAGQLGVNNGNVPLALVNDGTIDASGINALVIQTGGPAVVNNNLLEATGSGGLLITNSTTIDNSGTILAASGNVTLNNGADVLGGLLASTGGVFFTGNATLDGSAAAVTIGAGTTVQVVDGTTLDLLGTVNVSGTLADASVNYNTDLVVGAVTLSGSGELLLSDSGNNRIYGASSTNDTLINKTTIAGAGQLGINNGNNPLTLVNDGTINASGTNALIIQTGGPAVTNAGLLEATGTGGLVITNSTTIDNGGTILAAAGNVSLNNGADIVGGLLASTGGRFFTGNATLDGSVATPVTIGSNALLTVNDGTGLSLLGTIALAGTLMDGSVNYNTDLVLGTPTVTLTGSGELLLSDSGYNRVFGGSSVNDTLINNTTIAGAGQLGINNGNNPLTLVNDGTINASGTNALIIQTGGPAVTNAGLLEATGSGGLVITNSTTIDNGGTILAAAGNVSLNNGADIVGGLLASTGGRFFTGNATLDGSAATPVTIGSGTTVSVGDSTNLSLLGTIDLAGTLIDGSVNYNTDLVLGTPTVTLTGRGALILSDTGTNRIYGGSSVNDTLINNTTIAGAGQLGINNGNNPLTLVNDGTINASGTNALTIQAGGPAVTNAGLLEATGSGGLAITSSTTIDNSGTILAATGNVSLNNGADIVGGLLASTGGRFLTGNATLDGSGTTPITIGSGATVSVGDSTSLSLLGTIDLAGTLIDGSVNYNTDLVLSTPTVTLTGSGELILSDTGTNRIYGGSSVNDTLINEATIAGAGQLGISNGNNPLALVNDGTIDATGSNSLILQTGGPVAINAGVLEATGPGGLAITNGTTIDNTGTVAAIGSTVSFSSDSGATNDAGGTLTGGTWRVDGSVSAASLTFTGGAPITTDGASITLAGAGASFFAGGQSIQQSLTAVAASGLLTLNGGIAFNTANTLTIDAGGVVALAGSSLTTGNLAIAAGGTVEGYGTISGPVSGAGLLIASGGELTLAAAPAATTTLEIAAASTLELQAPFAGTIQFAPGAVSTLALDAPGDDIGTLANIGFGDTIDFRGAVVTAATISGSSLIVTANGTVYTEALSAAPSAIAVAITADASGTGNDVVFKPAVQDLAVPQINTANPVDLGGFRLGAAPTQTISITNATTPGGQSLTVSATASGQAASAGQITALGAGQTDASDISVSLNGLDAGLETGTVNLGFVSVGTPSTTLTSQAVGVDGTGYRLAGGAISVASGQVVRVHEAGTASVTVTNTAAADGYSEGLDAVASGATGGASLSGNVTDLSAGSSDTTSLQLTVDTSAAGQFSGTITAGLTSDGSGLDNAMPLGIGSANANYAITVDNLAVAAFANGTIINLGTASVGNSLSANLTVLNGADGSLPADLLGGAFTADQLDSVFSNDLNTLTPIAAGSFGTGGEIFARSTTDPGTFFETITFNPTSNNGSETPLHLAPVTVQVEATFIAASPPVPPTPVPPTPVPPTPVPPTPVPPTPVPPTPVPPTPIPPTPVPPTPVPPTPVPPTPVPPTPVPPTPVPPTPVPPPPVPPTPVPPNHHAGGSGDPHLTTFDGTRFDFQAAGEFVLAQNADFQVQARLEPSGGAQNPQGSVAYIQALALGIGSDRATIDYTRAQPLHVDGTPVSLSPGQSLVLASGTILALSGSSFQVTYLTGEVVVASPGAVDIDIPDSRSTGTGGILGPDDGNTADDFTLPDGTVLAQPLTFDQLYTTFADAWRVTQATSLFDYAAGQSTTTFTNTNFPPAPVVLTDLPDQLVQQAQQALAGTTFSNAQQQMDAELDYILGGGNLAAAQSNANPSLAGTVSTQVTNGPPPILFGITPATTGTQVGATATTATFDVFRTGSNVDQVVLDWTVVDPGQVNGVHAADYPGGFPSGQVTLEAGSTLAVFSVPTPAGLTLPSEGLEVQISAVGPQSLSFTNTTATGTLTSSVPVRGVDAAPSIYIANGIGTLTGSGNIYSLDFGTIGADGIPATTLGVLNGTTSYGDALGGSYTATGTGMTFGSIGAFSSITPGNADDVTLDPSHTVGTEIGTLVLHPTESNASGYGAVLPDITIVATATVVPPTAVPASVTSPLTETGRIGGLLSAGVTLTNTSVIGSDNLLTTITDTGGNVLVPQPGSLTPGASTTLSLSDVAKTPGTFQDTLNIGYMSTKPGATTGTLLPGTTVSLQGTSYASADPVLQTATIDFGTVHQGDPAPTAAITLSNSVALGAYADDLIASFAGATGPFGGTGTVDIAPGQSGALTASLSTSTGGTFSGTETIVLTTHDTALADAGLGSVSVTATGTVIGDAQPVFLKIAGPGTITQTDATDFVLNLGTFAQNSTASVSAAVANAAGTNSDSFSGTLSIQQGTSSVPIASFSNIAPGGKSSTFTTSVPTAVQGAFTETFILSPTDSYPGIILQNETLTVTGNVACFLEGTHIRTTRGEVAVQSLRIGDMAVMASGQLRPVTWLGHCYVDCLAHPRPQSVLPVRIAAGAFGGGLPERELSLSPDHSVFVNGVLIPARALLNGATIVQPLARAAHYYHVELDAHDALLAEGLPAESYLECGNRHVLEQDGSIQSLFPDFEPAVWDAANAFARLVEHGSEVDAVRATLLAQAAALGHCLVRSEDWQITHRGAALSLLGTDGSMRRFAVPAGARDLYLVSSFAVPAQVDPAARDGRRLGVALSGICLDDGTVRRHIPLDHPALVHGFHGLNHWDRAGHRWTDGYARLPAELWAGLAGSFVLELCVADIQPSWAAKEAPLPLRA